MYQLQYKSIINNFCPTLVLDPMVVIQPKVAYAAAPFRGVFTCSAKGYGYLNIKWLKGNDLLRLSQEWISTVRSSEITNSTLVIPNPTAKDAGTYYCEVQQRLRPGKITRESAILYISGMLFIL